MPNPKQTLKELKKIIPKAIRIRHRRFRWYINRGKLRRQSKPEMLIACPIKSLSCTEPKPRWIFITTKTRKSKGRCPSCGHFTGGFVNNQGYRMVHFKGTQRGEHRIVMESMLGRPLKKGETVHHKNAKRADNRTRNLELRMAGNHPKGWSLRQMREYLKTVPKRLGGLK